jgi:transposase
MRTEPAIPEELWDQIPPAVQAALLVVVRRYEERIAALQQRVEELEQRLGQDSSNSSKPPSSDLPHVKRRPPRERSERSRGGQRGHEAHPTPLLPADDVQTRKPTECRRCGHALRGEDPRPLRHQFLELPPIKPHVLEYQLHRLTCSRCGASTCAQPPAEHHGRYGPRLRGVVALLAGAYRLSKRQVETLCADLLGVPIAAGTVCKLERQTTAATEPVVTALRAYVRAQPLNMDETGWRQNGRRGWLWTAVSRSATVFHACLSRGADVARLLVGGGTYRRVLTSDRYRSYNWLPLRQRQICWAHLRRDFQAMIDRRNSGSAIGRELLLFAEDVFHSWHRVRDRTLRRSSLQTTINRQRPWFRDLLAKGCACACAKTAAVCRDLLRLETALWTFMRVPGVEPTNNAAERALRHAVLWRKLSQGTDSVAGSRYVANILTILATCRHQGRNVLDYLTACGDAYLRGFQPPSLLPQASG